MIYLYKPPKLLKKLYPNFIWESTVNKILITFDDSPNTGTTESILKVLEQNSIKALFFCVGKNVEKSPSLAKELISSGHMIGNHTYSHKKITSINIRKTNQEIVDCNRVFNDHLAIQPKYFRPPYGRFDPRIQKLMRKNNLINVMWSLITFDYKNDLNIVKFAVKNYLRENSIVVFHDNVKSKEIITDSINYLVEQSSVQGFEIGDPTECLK